MSSGSLRYLLEKEDATGKYFPPFSLRKYKKGRKVSLRLFFLLGSAGCYFLIMASIAAKELASLSLMIIYSSSHGTPLKKETAA